MSLYEIRERAMAFATQVQRHEDADDTLLSRAEAIRAFLDPKKTPISKAPPMRVEPDDDI